MAVKGARKKLARAAIFAAGMACGPAKAACDMWTYLTPQCQQEREQAAAARKARIDYICTKMGKPPGHRQYGECFRYVNYHLSDQPAPDKK